MKLFKFKAIAAVGVSSLVLAACGGGGGGSAPAAPATTSISGSGVKGPIFGAMVTVRNASSNAVVPGSSCTATARNGTYSCTIPAAATGPFKVELTGGTFCPTEVQVPESGQCPGAVTPKAVDTPLSTIVVGTAGATTFASAPITPFTTAAVARAGANPATFVQQYQTLAQTYGISPNPTDNPLAGGQQASLLAAIGASNQPLSQVLANIDANEVPTNAPGENTSQPAAATPDQGSSAGLVVPTAPPASGAPVTGGTGGTTGGSGGGSSSAS
ncbi:hypothetical protein [Limnobacter parvus]|uniref:Carboxypeptidase regulatory-like domain-containing protein n=1 Tax=Limnobacter parvus TaxID=2939690 RepID=A0ABT1XGG8_9BURK|nr:hypothetical protein [Limnobacter parvus]MCR2745204.1 hypothetical protein [Limnobacter parvus]